MRFYPNRFAKDSLVLASKPLSLPGAMRFQLAMNAKGVAETIAGSPAAAMCGLSASRASCKP